MGSVADKKRYRSPTRTECVDVSVSLSEFDDAELMAELAHRNGQTAIGPIEEYADIVALRSIRTLILCGQDRQALDAMREFCREVLGTAL